MLSSNFNVYRAIDAMNERLAGTQLRILPHRGHEGDVRGHVHVVRDGQLQYPPAAVLEIVFGLYGRFRADFIHKPWVIDAPPVEQERFYEAFNTIRG